MAAVRGLEDSSASEAPLGLKDKRSRTRFWGEGTVGWLYRISPGLKRRWFNPVYRHKKRGRYFWP